MVLVEDTSQSRHNDCAGKSNRYPEGHAAAAIIVAADRQAGEDDDDDEEDGGYEGEEADQNGADVIEGLVSLTVTIHSVTQSPECVNSMHAHRNEDDEDDEINEEHDLVRATEVELGLLRTECAPPFGHSLHFVWRK